MITFTEKAAAELSTRVRDALERRAAASDGAERERVLAAGARPVPLPHRDDPQLRHRAAARAAGRGRDRPAVRGRRRARRQPLVRRRLRGLPGRAAVLANPRARPCAAARARAGRAPRGLRADLTSTATCARCGSPPHHDGELAAHLAQFRRIADELRALMIECDPGEDRGVDVVEGIIEWVDAARGARRPRPSRSSCSSTAIGRTRI